MANIVKGTIGNEDVELNNAATETTLSAMLAFAKHDSAVLKEMAKKAGVDAKTIEKAAKAMEEQGKHGGAAGGALGSLAPKVSILGGFMADMVQSVGATIGNLTQFGDELLEGKARASDLFKAFKDLPLGLGLVASVFEKVMKYQQANLDTYQKLSSTGAGLNGSLTSLRTKAFDMGLTLDEMANMFQKNGDILKYLGGTANEGGKNLASINAAIFKSKMSDRLLGLGYSFEQLANLTGSYIRASGDSIDINKDNAKEVKRITDASMRYGENLDFLARLTGESRESAEKKIEAENMEISWRRRLAQMEPKEREQAAAQVAQLLLTQGKGAVDTYKAFMMGFAGPMSEAGMTYMSTMGESVKGIKGLVAVTKNGQTIQQNKNLLDKLNVDIIHGSMKSLDRFGKTIDAMGQGGTEANQAMMEVAEKVQQYVAGRMNRADLEKAIKLARDGQDADAKATQATIQSEKAMKDLSASLNTALAPIMSLLAVHANDVVKSFIEFTSNVDFEKLGKQVAVMMAAVSDYIKYLFDPAGRAKIISDIKDLFAELLIELKLAVNPLYSQNDAIKERKERMLNARVVEAKAKEAQALEQRNELNQKIYDAEHRDERDGLINNNKQMTADKEALEKKKDLSAEEQDWLARINKGLDENTSRLKASASISGKENEARLADAKKTLDTLNANVDKAKTDTADYTARYNTYKGAGWLPDNVQEDKTKWDYETGKKKFSGGTPSYGEMLMDFGKGQTHQLDGKEAVLNEKQLMNMAQGAADTGAARAQEKLAEAMISLNKQVVLQTKVMEQISDYNRRLLDRVGGNKFLG